MKAMHKRNSSSTWNKRKIAGVLAVIYIAGVFLGCFVTWAIPVCKSKEDLLQLSVEMGHQVLSAGVIEASMLFGMEYLMYDQSGRLITEESQFLHAEKREQIGKYASQIFENGSIFQPTFFLLEDEMSRSLHIFGIIIGSVVEAPNGNRFASILVRDLPDVATTMLIYLILFTIMFITGASFVFVTFQKERELNRMRRDLIANVSHELKTPITTIRAMAEVLYDGMVKDPKSCQRYSGKILEESDKLEQMVIDILELSKLQSKHSDFRKSRIYADEILPPVIDRYMMLCGDLGIEFDTTELNIESIPSLYTDKDKLITLLNILLDNAVKFTGTGGKIWFSSQLCAKSVTLCVRDNGPGIQSEDLPRIFDRFYKADVAHTSGGSGLGLAIAHEIARGLGEKLYVESTYGVGSAFYFTIGF